MLQYRLDVTYYNNEINFTIMLLDEVIMTKTYYVTKHGPSYHCDGDFLPDDFDKLVNAMRSNTDYDLTYQTNGRRHQRISYNSDTEILSFVDKSENNVNTVNINMFNADNSQRMNQFANEFLKVKKFVSCLKDDSDE